MEEGKKHLLEDFHALFEETVFQRDIFDEANNVIGVDINSYKADAVRSMLIQVDFAGHTNRISPICSYELKRQLYDDYRNVVDAENEVLAVCKHRKNESSKFKSLLSELSRKDLVAHYGKNVETTPFKPTHDEKEKIIKTLLKTPSEQSEIKKNSAVANCFKKQSENYYESVTSSSSSFEKCENTSKKPFWANKDSNLKKCQQSITQGPSMNKRKNEFNDSHEQNEKNPCNSFKTAKDIWVVEQKKKTSPASTNLEYGSNKKTLGTRSNISRKFMPPIANNSNSCDKIDESKLSQRDVRTTFQMGDKIFEFDPERVKNLDPKMIELMMNEILEDSSSVTWDDIAGLEFAKKTIQEIVIWPLLRPDIFKGLRGPPKGILLFGPPGTGKTLIGKCIANQSKSTFFSISASSITSKWIGDSEKLVRTLFTIAKILQPSVVFIDEIDSLLTQRSEQEHESSRRLKTEFLVQLDGAATSSDDRILIVGATNRPQELDEAARRRLVKRLYIPLPEDEARRTIIMQLLKQLPNSLTSEDLDIICQRTNGYSGADMANLCKEAALGPIRQLHFGDIEHIPSEQLRPISVEDFILALSQVRASVSKADLQSYLKWNSEFGSSYMTKE